MNDIHELRVLNLIFYLFMPPVENQSQNVAKQKFKRNLLMKLNGNNLRIYLHVIGKELFGKV